MEIIYINSLTVFILFLLCSCGKAQYAESSYDMNVPGRCNFAGYMTVKTGQQVTLSADGTTANAQRCKLSFSAEDDRAEIQISFNRLIMDDCSVRLTITLTGNSNPIKILTCKSAIPGALLSPSGKVSIEMTRDYLDAKGYNFQMVMTAYIPGQDPQLTDANPIAVGLVVGITGGIIFFLVMLAIIGVCCYKKKKEHDRRMAEQEYKMRLDEPEMSTTSYGYANEVTANGRYNGDDTPRSDKKLLMNSHENQMAEKTSPLIGSYATSPTKSDPFKYNQPLRQSGGARRDNAINEKKIKLPAVDNESVELEEPKSPILADLHSNPKFRASFAATEAEAEERRKRISSYTSDDHDSETGASPVKKTSHSQAQGNRNYQENKIPEAPPLPIVPKSPRVSRSAFASIKRAPRPSSSGSELDHLQHPYDSEEDDNGIKVIHDSDDPPSPSEVVPIRVYDPQSAANNKPSSHTLRPNRGKSQQNKQKDSQSVVEKEQPRQRAADPERAGTRPAGGFQKNSSQRKKSHKSPRIGRLASRPSTGSIIDDDRPGTPNSMASRNQYDDDDLDNFAPLERSQSRQSLYSSRSSLYGRRRRRERRNSFGESVSTYTRDDIDAYDDSVIHSRPISRRDKFDRGYKSLGDLEYEMREQSTQTLRETATQTGRGHAVVMNPKRVVDKKPKHEHMSSSSTQTVKKTANRRNSETESRPRTPKLKSKSVDLDTELKNESEPSKPRKTKKKSDKPKRKPTVDSNSEVGDKPKPKPRKTATVGSSADELNEANSKAAVDEVEKPNAYENVAFSQPGSYVGQNMPMTVPVMNPQYMGQPMYVPQYSGPGGVPVIAQYPAGFPNYQVPVQPMSLAGPQPAAGQPSVNPASTGLPDNTSKVPPASQPSKSKWEMLCSLTDSAEHPQQMQETESVTGSVFSSAHYPASTSASGQPLPTQYVPSSIVPGLGSAYPASDVVPQSHSSNHPSQHSSEREGSSSSSIAPPPSSSMNPRKSSWEALKELTDKQYTLTYGSNYEHSESNV